MGLGKTLSILSLITDDVSWCVAREWANQKPYRSRATLLVCPLSTIANWEEQLHRHVEPGVLKHYVYHGPNRTQKIDELAQYDLVITTYPTVAHDVSPRMPLAPSKTRPLEKIKWFRIVLDEAHCIRTQNTKQSQAICGLTAKRRWAVTGTPLQNRLDDLGALFKFLRLKPFDSSSGFLRWIVAPFKAADPEIVMKLQLLVGSVTLRRMKEGLIDLPPRQDRIVRLRFSRDEQTLHDWFERDSARKVNAVTASHKLQRSAYAQFLGAILNLRLICAHGQELLSDEAMKATEGINYGNAIEIPDDEDEPQMPPSLTPKQAYDMLRLLQETDEDRCAQCDSRIGIREASEPADEEETRPEEALGFMTQCYQVVCCKCIANFRELMERSALEGSTSKGRFQCPFCEQVVANSVFELRKDDFDADEKQRQRLRKNPKLAKKMGRYIGPHTKTRALLEMLEQDRVWSQAHASEEPIKSVVFSTWTSHLDLIQIAFENAGLRYTRLDGSMRRQARRAALDTFAQTCPSYLCPLAPAAWVESDRCIESLRHGAAVQSRRRGAGGGPSPPSRTAPRGHHHSVCHGRIV